MQYLTNVIKKPRNTQKQKYDIYLTQPIKYSTKEKNDRKGVVYPISFFHGHIPLRQVQFYPTGAYGTQGSRWWGRTGYGA